MIFFTPFFFFFKSKLQTFTKYGGFFFNLIEFIYKFNLFLLIWCYILYFITAFFYFRGVNIFSPYNDIIHSVFFLFLRGPVEIIIEFYGYYYPPLAHFTIISPIIFLKWLVMVVYSETFVLI